MEFYRTRDLLIGYPSAETMNHDMVNPHLSDPTYKPPMCGVGTEKEFPLFGQIQIQTIEFCNLKCDFCPNHYMIWDRIEDKKKGIPYNAMETTSIIKENNIIPSVQPTHATSDFSWAILRLGKERLNNCYIYFDLMNQNNFRNWYLK